MKLSSGVLSPLYWAFRRLHYWLCFYNNDVEIDMEDLLTNPFNTQPPSLDDLEKLTGFRRDWIMFLYRNFKQICSNGRMSQTQWRQIFRLLFKGASDYQFADRIFMAIAGNRAHPLITFEDLILCLYDLIQSFRCSKEQDSVPSIKKYYERHGSPQIKRSYLWNNFVTKSAECSFDENGITAEFPVPSSSSSMGTLIIGKHYSQPQYNKSNEKKMESPVPSTTTAQFAFSLMQPDARGLVDEAAFLRYTKCIFDLNASMSSSSDMATFGMIQHMGYSNGGGGQGLEGGSVSYSQTSSNSNEHSRSSKRDKNEQFNFMPWQEAIAKQQFRALDADGDGFITLEDIKRLFDQRKDYESLVLHLESEITQHEQPRKRTSRYRNANRDQIFINNKNAIAINVN